MVIQTPETADSRNEIMIIMTLICKKTKAISCWPVGSPPVGLLWDHAPEPTQGL